MFFHNFNDAVVIDHVTPKFAGKTPRGFTKILTITDAWSNYLVALPCRGETAPETAALIQKYWIEKYGPFHEILSDNAPGYAVQSSPLPF